jgi:phosphatidylglycerophosphatase C
VHNAAPASASRRLALFDLDGTLTRRDTLAQYLTGYLREHRARWRGVPAALPSLARYALGAIGRGELKSVWIAAILGGCTRAEIESWTARFVPQLIESGLLADARATLEQHRQAGDYLVLLSASPDLYVPEIGRALGFAESVCTGIEWLDGHITGKLATPNRRGAEKARCLAALRTQHPGLPVTAYGNAASDLPHLALAERGVLVNAPARARRRAAQLGVSCVRWH